jgi:hypothetical protein
MIHFLYRLIPPRPSFPADMSEAEGAIPRAGDPDHPSRGRLVATGGPAHPSLTGMGCSHLRLNGP